MRRKKPIDPEKDFPFESPPPLDLDPTTNEELHHRIWSKLKEKIKSE
jgi:hypothetical protein